MGKEMLKEKIFNFFVKELDASDLKILLKDLEEGSAKRTKELVRKRLRQLKRAEQKICVTCGKIIEMHDNSYTILIGPDGFQKRASFCALDCMDYFRKKLSTNYSSDKLMVKELGSF